MVEKELIILLQIVIRLVGIIMFFIIVSGIHFPARIISSSEFLHFLLRCISPGMISLFFSGKCNQFDGSVLCEISSLQIVRVEVY